VFFLTLELKNMGRKRKRDNFNRVWRKVEYIPIDIDIRNSADFENFYCVCRDKYDCLCELKQIVECVSSMICILLGSAW